MKEVISQKSKKSKNLQKKSLISKNLSNFTNLPSSTKYIIAINHPTSILLENALSTFSPLMKKRLVIDLIENDDLNIENFGIVMKFADKQSMDVDLMIKFLKVLATKVNVKRIQWELSEMLERVLLRCEIVGKGELGELEGLVRGWVSKGVVLSFYAVERLILVLVRFFCYGEANFYFLKMQLWGYEFRERFFQELKGVLVSVKETERAKELFDRYREMRNAESESEGFDLKIVLQDYIYNHDFDEVLKLREGIGSHSEKVKFDSGYSEAIYIAIEDQDIELIEILIKLAIDLNVSDLESVFLVLKKAYNETNISKLILLYQYYLEKGNANTEIINSIILTYIEYGDFRNASEVYSKIFPAYLQPNIDSLLLEIRFSENFDQISQLSVRPSSESISNFLLNATNEQKDFLISCLKSVGVESVNLHEIVIYLVKEKSLEELEEVVESFSALSFSAKTSELIILRIIEENQLSVKERFVKIEKILTKMNKDQVKPKNYSLFKILELLCNEKPSNWLIKQTRNIYSWAVELPEVTNSVLDLIVLLSIRNSLISFTKTVLGRYKTDSLFYFVYLLIETGQRLMIPHIMDLQYDAKSPNHFKINLLINDLIDIYQKPKEAELVYDILNKKKYPFNTKQLMRLIYFFIEKSKFDTGKKIFEEKIDLFSIKEKNEIAYTITNSLETDDTFWVHITELDKKILLFTKRKDPSVISLILEKSEPLSHAIIKSVITASKEFKNLDILQTYYSICKQSRFSSSELFNSYLDLLVEQNQSQIFIDIIIDGQSEGYFIYEKYKTFLFHLFSAEPIHPSIVVRCYHMFLKNKISSPSLLLSFFEACYQSFELKDILCEELKETEVIMGLIDEIFQSKKYYLLFQLRTFLRNNNIFNKELKTKIHSLTVKTLRIKDFPNSPKNLN